MQVIPLSVWVGFWSSRQSIVSVNEWEKEKIDNSQLHPANHGQSGLVWGEIKARHGGENWVFLWRGGGRGGFHVAMGNDTSVHSIPVGGNQFKAHVCFCFAIYSIWHFSYGQLGCIFWNCFLMKKKILLYFRLSSTQCTGTSRGYIWCAWDRARAFRDPPRSCRTSTTRRTCSRRQCLRRWRRTRTSSSPSWRSTRIRSPRDSETRLDSPTLIGKCLTATLVLCRPIIICMTATRRRRWRWWWVAPNSIHTDDDDYNNNSRALRVSSVRKWCIGWNCNSNFRWIFWHLWRLKCYY